MDNKTTTKDGVLFWLKHRAGEVAMGLLGSEDGTGKVRDLSPVMLSVAVGHAYLYKDFSVIIAASLLHTIMLSLLIPRP